jgi:PAS domain S-box-containing protein
VSDLVLFDHASCGLALLADDGAIIRANDAFRLWTGYPSEQLVGMKFQDLLTTPGRMFYYTHVDPLLRMQGAVYEIACRMKNQKGEAVPVYANFLRETAPDGGPAQINLSVFRGQDRAKYEEELRSAKRRAEQLSSIVEASIDAIVSVDLDGVILTANNGFGEIFLHDPASSVGKHLRQLICPAEQQAEFEHMLDEARANRALRVETVRVRRDGVVVNVSLSMSPIRNDFGEVRAASVIYRDITERVRAAEHIGFLMNEVNHRSKNLLAVVQGIARQTGRRAKSVSAFLDQFSARLSAMAASHDLLVSRDWSGVELHDLVKEQLRHVGEAVEEQVTLDGPLLKLSPRAAEAIGLALHELSTNAVKYGALSHAAGRVTLTWSVSDGSFALTWTESGGPAVAPPTEKGFGSSLLERLAPQSVGGTGAIAYEVAGLAYRLVAQSNVILGG